MLIKGDRSKDITIEAGDTILANAASQFIEIKGAVRRPAIYEVLQDETLNDIIKFSLGFNETANKSNISIEILDLDSASVTSKTTSNLDFALDNALSINVFNYLIEKKSEISVLGAVEKQGLYSIEKYKTLEGLINDLNFVDEYPWLAVFEQFDKDNFVYSSILFSLKDKETYKDINILQTQKYILLILIQEILMLVINLKPRLMTICYPLIIKDQAINCLCMVSTALKNL